MITVLALFTLNVIVAPYFNWREQTNHSVFDGGESSWMALFAYASLLFKSIFNLIFVFFDELAEWGYLSLVIVDCMVSFVLGSIFGLVYGIRNVPRLTFTSRLTR